jgi:class 3 adenylate cyclase
VAVAEWQAVSAPYEVARVRTLLGRAIAARGDHEGAKLELQAARSAFLKLGARPDLELVDQLLSAGPEPVAPVHDQKAFLFSDIVKSTNLVEAIGDDAWVDLLRWHDETLRALFAQHRGEEVDHAGDGFFVAFDGPDAALSCAIAVQRSLAEHRRTHGFAPAVRIGVHSAPTTRSGKRFTGRAVHEAARISALAEGGEIVASARTAAALKSPISLVAKREVRLKGIAEPFEVVTVDWR